MAKKIIFECFKYRFLIAAQSTSYHSECNGQPSWNEFVRRLEFNYVKGNIDISWKLPSHGQISEPLDVASFYVRGDSEQFTAQQREICVYEKEDPIKIKNRIYFKEIVMRVAESASYINMDNMQNIPDQQNIIERDFHDAWAESEDVEKINVRASNEVCTAPEMRYITKRLGNIKGKRLLDVGCGLGEASVYFALLGADVTASDLSQGMLNATSRLAKANNVSIKTHIASAENLQLPPDVTFDIIYAGNLLHHVDIEETIIRIKPHLVIGGIFVSWDPLAYNPAINVYRSLATDVRTPDEHPLKLSDILLFRKHFKTVETRYFWLTTLIIFVIMALAQRRNPNKERFWKVVVHEGDKWNWLYQPLERLDSLLLRLFSPLRLLCWNVVVICKIK